MPQYKRPKTQSQKALYSNAKRARVAQYGNMLQKIAGYAYSHRRKLKSAFNTWRSRTASRTKTKKLIRKPATHGGQGGISTSYCKIAYRIPKEVRIAKKLTNLCNYLQIKKFSATSAQSQQGVSTIDYVSNTADLKLVFESINQYYNTTGAAFVNQGAIGSTSGQSLKFLYYSCQSEVRMINQSPSLSEFELHLIMAKNTNAGGTDPKTFWDEGYTHQANNNTATSKEIPYTRPTDSKVFNTHWKIVKTVKGSLNPGETHKHTFNFKPNRVIDTQYLNDFGELRGLTFGWMLVVRGTPADDTNSGTAAAKIGLTGAKIVGVVKNTYKSAMVTSYPRTATFTSDLDNDAVALYVQDEVQDGPVDAVAGANFA